jgi:hypothetical protein
VGRFAREVSDTIQRWAERVHHWQRQGRRVAVWGAGSKCVAFMTSTATAGAISNVVDINPNQQKKYLPGVGHQIMAPGELARYQPDVLLVMNPAYRQEIERDLSAMGVQAEVYSV